TWKGIQYTFNRLPQGYKHSPTIAHNALAKVLAQTSFSPGIAIYQYIDDILIASNTKDQVEQDMTKIINKLEQMGLEIPPSKIQTPAQEVKF
ncbi:hypothetical protein FQV23_0004844, partial [Spheniscus humboldti]